ncbi:adenylosuccinate lyase family protein [Salinicola endophyticus]|uniref:Adenylosuccinate lyase family protein n=1 Tax=Salinicola endophyticus TaxID=1949083 RepID=A0ABY8FJA8_9GAMM|nr:lyase family protein [Salinicola endophyticus]WFF40661.1 adenylosuccinate lyase family protein [Salinicola endophyticus]
MYDTLFRHPFMSAAGLAALEASEVVAAMREVELALAAEQEACGLLPAGTADALTAALPLAAFDLTALAAEVENGGNAAIPFVKQAKARLPESLRRHFHRGATSQDIVDSALMLLLRPRLAALREHLACSRRAACALMRRHRGTPMIGRTLMQQALPITFGAKVAQWAWGLESADARLAAVAEGGLYVQFGGAVGVHSGLDDQGLEIMAGLAARLGLAAPLLPWHTDRQPLLALMGALDAAAVAAEKVALDIALLCQSEVAELSEPAAEGVGGSSSMPHKRNPVACARIRAAARQVHAAHATVVNAGAQPLERGLGEWHAEWAPLLDGVLLVEGALGSLAPLLAGLEVHVDAMARNLRLSGGAVLAEPAARLLGEALPSATAQRIAREAGETARREQRDYAEVVLAQPEVAAAVEDATLDAAALRTALTIDLYIGSSEAQVTRVLMRLDPS